MAKRSVRMGITYKLKKTNKIMKKKSILNNQVLKVTFYTTLIFWSTYSVKTNAIFNNFLLGKRYGFSILNAEHHIMMLKRATKFLFKLKNYGQKILFVNEPLNQNFDGIVKALAFRSLQPVITGKWPNGFLIKKKSLKYSVFFFNPNKSTFSTKEANKVGIPIISLNGIENDAFKSMYPIFCNNLQGDSVLFISFILSNSIIEAHLFRFIKKNF
jgi:ribosomal protein S2